MNTRDTMIVDFRVVQDDWSCERGFAIASERRASWIVVEHRADDGSSTHYIVVRDRFLAKMAGKRGKTIERALVAYAGMEAAPPWAATAKIPVRHEVVLAGRRVVGIVAPPVISRGGTARGTRGGAGKATPKQAVKRYLLGDLPGETAAHGRVELTVWLSALAEDATGSAAVDLAVGTTIDVIVRTGDRLKLTSTDSRTLTVTHPQTDARLRFELETGDEGVGRVSVYAFAGGVSIAALSLSTTIKAAAAVAATPVPATTMRPVEVPSGPPPDLSIYIFEHGPQLSFNLQSSDGRLQMQRYGPILLGSRVREYFATFFEDIERMAASTDAERAAVARHLSSKGADLFRKVCPESLRTDLWALRDRIRTIQITSEEPWIPWELCRLSGRTADGRTVDGPFLADFCLTRWLYGVSAARTIPLRNVALVVPDDSGLDHAPIEGDFIRSLARDGRKVVDVEPTYLGVTDAMIDGTYDAWHFVGHANADPGADADRSPIELRGGEKLTPTDVAGSVENVLLPRPFVFLNACQSGRGGLSLTGIGGWAERFLKPDSRDAAASAFIGSLWAVDDASAVGFATAFYTAMLDGLPIGEAVRTARHAIRKDGDATWLAYTAYADPAARIDLGPGSPLPAPVVSA